MFSCKGQIGRCGNPNAIIKDKITKNFIIKNNIIENNSISKPPLQAHINNVLRSLMCRRIYRTAPFSGSITVEASIILPLFIFSMLSLFLLGEGIRVKCIIYEGLVQTAEQMAQEAYIEKIVDEKEGLGEIIKTARKGISCASAKKRLAELIDDRELVEKLVSGGMDGLKITQARLMADDHVHVKLSYKIKARVPVIGGVEISCSEKVRQRAFIGYTKENDEDSDGVYVYMTKTGRVYHDSRSCYHIKLTIFEVNERKLEKSYSHLSPCELCAKGGRGDAIYVTADGERYHYSLGCSGLKRTVYRVKKDECGSTDMCSECSKKRR